MKVKVDKKACSKCRAILPATKFYKRKQSPDGLSYLCKSCADEITQASRDKWRELFRSGKKQAVKEKVCSCCKELKPASEFYPDTSYASGLRSRCKACNRLARKKSPIQKDEKGIKK